MNKLKPTFKFQNSLLKNIKINRPKYVIGIDEVGRGPLAGDVFACAVFINQEDFPNELENKINDSKKITEKKRENIFYELINNKNISYGIGRQTVNVIDDINILQATFLSMKDAYLDLKQKLNILDNDTYILIDGNLVPPFFKNFSNVEAIVSGDSLAISIAAASIIAKVSRDNYMRELSYEYPQYKFEKNKGYGTKQHIDAIKEFGPCKIHRKSFLKKIIF